MWEIDLGSPISEWRRTKRQLNKKTKANWESRDERVKLTATSRGKTKDRRTVKKADGANEYIAGCPGQGGRNWSGQRTKTKKENHNSTGGMGCNLKV